MIKIALGVCFVAMGIYLIVKSKLVKKQGVHVEGVVTGYREKEGHMFPMVHFTYNGEELDYTASCAHKKPKYADGDAVSGFFVEKDSSVYLDGENSELKNGIFLTLAGVAILVFCFL